MKSFFVAWFLFAIGTGADVNAPLDERTQIYISVADSVIQGQAFFVAIELVDPENQRPIPGDYWLDVSADKPDIAMPEKLLLQNGSGGFWATGRSWKGAGLRFSASADIGDGRPIGGLSDAVTILPGGTAPLGQLSQIFVSAPDTVKQGEQFYVQIQLADQKKRDHRGSYALSLSANKPDIELPWGDQLVDGRGGFRGKSSLWHGDGLRFDVRIALENGAQLGGVSNAVVVLPATVDAQRALSQIFLSAPDTVKQGEAFWVQVKLEDRAGRLYTDSQGIAISANKSGISMPTSDQFILSGEGGFWAKSLSWQGEGLRFAARITRYDGTQLGGVSNAMVVLPETK